MWDENGQPMSLFSVRYTAACPTCGNDVEWFERQAYTSTTKQSRTQITINCGCPYTEEANK